MIAFSLIARYWEVFATIGGTIGGAVVGVFVYFFKRLGKHDERLNGLDKKIVAIDDRLSWGKERFDRNDSDHEDIKNALSRLGRGSAAARDGVKDLLVHFGLRRPGEDINGEGIDEEIAGDEA